MTNIPVASLYAALSLDPTNLEGGIAKAQRGLAGIQNAFKQTSGIAASAGDKIDGGLTKGLNAATVSSKTLGAEFDRLRGRMDPLAAAVGNVDKAAEKLDRQLKRGVVTAEQHATAMAALKDRGLAAVAIEADRLKMKFDPLYASSKKYESAVQELDRALSVGAITQQRYDASMEQLNAQLAAGATSFGMATTQAQRFNAMAGDMSAYTGNIAAQFQDIGVQLAGGQSPFLIALQQGSQLNGVFAQMGGGVKGVLAGLGGAVTQLVSPLSLVTLGAIAAGGALVQWFMASKTEALSLKDALSGLEEAVSRVDAVTRTYTAEGLQELVDKYGEVDTAIINLTERQRQYAQDRAMAAARDAVVALSSEYNALSINLEAVGEAARGPQIQIGAIASQLGLSRDQAVALIQAMQDASRAEGFDAQAEALARIAEIMQQSTQSGSELTGALIEAEASIRRLAQAVPAANWLSGMIDQARTLAGNLADALGIKLRLQEQEGRGTVEGLNLSMQYAQYGQGRNAARELVGTGYRLPEASAPSTRGGSGGGAVDQTARDVERLNEAVANGITPLDRFRAGLAKLDALKGKGLSDAAYSQELARLNDELASSIPMVDDVADAFGKFVVDGFKDFQGFVKSIGNSFKKLLADMIATAARNRIMIGLGIGGGVGGVGSIASAGTGLLGGGGGILAGVGGLGGAASGLWSGLSGVLSGGGIGSSFANLGGLISGSVGGLGAIGAAIPALGAIGLVAGLFSKKVKLLDEGLNIATNGLSTAAQSFSTKQTSRFFGLSKKTSTSYSAADPGIAGVIGAIQSDIMRAAASLGVGAQAFQGFAYNINLSLKGLTEEQRAAKVAEEVGKLGDAFARMIPNISSVNDLMAVMQQRYGLETQLLTLQGNTAELRRRELENINPYNRALQQQIWAMEDAQKATDALSNALGNLSENDYATALDFNRARGALASGLRVVGGTDTVAPFAPPAAGSTAAPMDARMEAILANINSNIALLWKQVQRWDIDGLPAERA